MRWKEPRSNHKNLHCKKCGKTWKGFKWTLGAIWLGHLKLISLKCQTLKMYFKKKSLETNIREPFLGTVIWTYIANLSVVYLTFSGSSFKKYFSCFAISAIGFFSSKLKKNPDFQQPGHPVTFRNAEFLFFQSYLFSKQNLKSRMLFKHKTLVWYYFLKTKFSGNKQRLLNTI